MSTSHDIITYAITVAVALISGPGLWGLVQFILSRKKVLREELRQRERERLDAERSEDERIQLLATAQATAQRTALESADRRFTDLHEDYQDCQSALTAVREVTWLLIDVLESFLMQLQPVGTNGSEIYQTTIKLSEVGEAKRAINEARLRLR